MYAISDMMRISLAQYVIVFLVTVVSAFFVGQDAAYTALMAGLAYAVPTTLLALFLVLPKFLTAYSPSAVAVLGGEFVKILVVVLLLGLMVGYYENLHWPDFIFTIIAVANSYFIIKDRYPWQQKPLPLLSILNITWPTWLPRIRGPLLIFLS